MTRFYDEDIEMMLRLDGAEWESASSSYDHATRAADSTVSVVGVKKAQRRNVKDKSVRIRINMTPDAAEKIGKSMIEMAESARAMIAEYGKPATGAETQDILAEEPVKSE